MDISDKKLDELKLMAKELGIKNYSKYRKSELIEIIEKAQQPIEKSNVEKIKKDINNDQVKIERNGVTLQENIRVKNPKENSTENKVENRNQEENLQSLDIAKGVLEINESNSFGFLRGKNFLSTSDDIYVSPAQIRRFNLRTGDEVQGRIRQANDGEKFKALRFVEKVNGENPQNAVGRIRFEKLTPIYPSERLILETEKNQLSTRLMDFICPIGKGQRGVIVAPPKAGKTTLLKNIANSITKNNPGVKLILALIDERPEEVTEMERSIEGDVLFSTFDQEPDSHIRVANMILERCKRMVEQGQDVVILLDSLTRLTRANNLRVAPSGRTLSGGLDPGALHMPKRLFGAARNVEGGGSLTILATALVDTGSRMDDVIFEEFKGTGNMEVHLDRKLQERRIFPAIDIYKSGTRREEYLLTKEEQKAAMNIRKKLYTENTQGVTELVINLLSETENNDEFIKKIYKEK